MNLTTEIARFQNPFMLLQARHAWPFLRVPNSCDPETLSPPLDKLRTGFDRLRANGFRGRATAVFRMNGLG